MKSINEKIKDNTIWKGEITDSKGRKLILKNPDLWDTYLLSRAMGKDSEVLICNGIAQAMLRVAAIDGILLTPPNSYNEFAANMKIFGMEGYNAVMDHFSVKGNSDEEEIDEIKK